MSSTLNRATVNDEELWDALMGALHKSAEGHAYDWELMQDLYPAVVEYLATRKS